MWRVEVWDGKIWVGNSLKFVTREAAKEYILQLYGDFASFVTYRIVSADIEPAAPKKRGDESGTPA